MVVAGLPGPKSDRGRVEVGKSLPPPEFFLVDAMTAFHFAVLLRAPGFDISVSDPQRLDGQRKGERELVSVVPAESW